MTAAITLLLFASVHSGFQRDSRLIAQTDGRVQDRSDYLVVKGRYSNYDYSYSVRIPRGMTGMRSPSPFPNHGFAIQLSDHPEASVTVDASYNAAEWKSFNDAIEVHLDIFKRKVGGEVSIVARVPTTLAKLRAIRFTMKPTTRRRQAIRNYERFSWRLEKPPEKSESFMKLF